MSEMEPMNIVRHYIRPAVLTTLPALCIVFTSCGSQEPEIARDEFDRAIGTAVADTKKTVSDSTDNEPAAGSDIRAEEVFADVFQNATKVDRISIDDINNCRVVSTYEVKLGDAIVVEVALARKEDSRGLRFNLRPYFTVIRDRSGDEVLGNDSQKYPFRFEELGRTINNPWNEKNTGPNRVAVYRGKRSLQPEPPDGNFVVGDWVPNWGAFVPGTYTVGFVKDESVRSHCSEMVRAMDVTNLVPDSVLIAWYVN